jgi:NADH dehydrogenase (ubiquinone) Fe-S protein 1
MRPQLFRAAARSLRVPKVTLRTFATTAPRAAEVELTIGTSTPGLVHPG